MAILDLITLTEAKRALNIPATTINQDSELVVFITAASLRIDEMCGAVVTRAIASELHDGGTSSVTLRKAPIGLSAVTTITTVSEYLSTTATALTAESNAVKPASGYVFDVAQGTLYRRSSGGDGYFAAGRRNVDVAYSPGRYADTASVDAKFKQAALICTAHMFRNEQGFSAIDTEGVPFGRSFSLPRRALELLADEMLPPGLA